MCYMHTEEHIETLPHCCLATLVAAVILLFPIKSMGEEIAAGDTLEVNSPVAVALKTNLLYDVSLVPHLGVEAQFCGRWSISLQGWWSDWCRPKKHKYWRISGSDLELRYWFGKKAYSQTLTGHHIGLFGEMYHYDVMLGKYGHQTPANNYAVGLSYGYSIAVADRLNIDLSLSVGYAEGRMMKYEEMCGQYVSVHRSYHHYFGPVNAAVTLVWRIGSKNCRCNPGNITMPR